MRVEKRSDGKIAYRFDNLSMFEQAIHISRLMNERFKPANERKGLYVEKIKHNSIAVYKCFVKMALSVMPECYMYKFVDTVTWIMNDNHKNFYDNGRELIVRSAEFDQGKVSYDFILNLWKRNDSIVNIPYMLFQIAYGGKIDLLEIPIRENCNCKTIKEFEKEFDLLDDLRDISGVPKYHDYFKDVALT